MGEYSDFIDNLWISSPLETGLGLADQNILIYYWEH